jgi:hypothetical protein
MDVSELLITLLPGPRRSLLVIDAQPEAHFFEQLRDRSSGDLDAELL